jgi:hypothetical protein
MRKGRGRQSIVREEFAEENQFPEIFAIVEDAKSEIGDVDDPPHVTRSFDLSAIDSRFEKLVDIMTKVAG